MPCRFFFAINLPAQGGEISELCSLAVDQEGVASEFCAFGDGLTVQTKDIFVTDLHQQKHNNTRVRTCGEPKVIGAGQELYGVPFTFTCGDVWPDALGKPGVAADPRYLDHHTSSRRLPRISDGQRDVPVDVELFCSGRDRNLLNSQIGTDLRFSDAGGFQHHFSGVSGHSLSSHQSANQKPRRYYSEERHYPLSKCVLRRNKTPGPPPPLWFIVGFKATGVSVTLIASYAIYKIVDAATPDQYDSGRGKPET
ncbi:hypothetical protein [Silicimonas algicola]|uniref:hypothetical protein n=1 Tax=Silicimonas algicola TaxID=1826607 RepID=UPI0013DFD916|nr:hypothetical protein [Silicimonas algicola]